MSEEETAEYERLQEEGYRLLSQAHEIFLAAFNRNLELKRDAGLLGKR